MTTEIAIMNKTAIALAADSAVTITINSQQENQCKVLNSANKLFTLSKHAPVGLMIYGNASLLDIPWETIVKMYRNQLADQEFPCLQDYCDDFFRFLNDIDVSEETQRLYVANVAACIFHSIRKHNDEWVEQEISENGEVSAPDIAEELTKRIQEEDNKFAKMADNSVFSEDERTTLIEKYRDIILQVADQFFENLPIDDGAKTRLFKIAINAASIGPRNQSGIVIAGFGTNEIYPQCFSFDVAAVFEKRTIKRDGERHEITSNMGASIMPFAQSDDVATFMEGISPNMKTFLKQCFASIMIEHLPSTACKKVQEKTCFTDEQASILLDITKDICRGAYEYAFEQINQLQSKYYAEPIIRATEFLNKSELAAMAETLVNLVSFRKQVSMEAETVGGPIDVAVITKGDGFVWIKRKHYFPAELNHHFFSNYYRKAISNA